MGNNRTWPACPHPTCPVLCWDLGCRRGGMPSERVSGGPQSHGMRGTTEILLSASCKNSGPRRRRFLAWRASGTLHTSLPCSIATRQGVGLD